MSTSALKRKMSIVLGGLCLGIGFLAYGYDFAYRPLPSDDPQLIAGWIIPFALILTGIGLITGTKFKLRDLLEL
jgi:hypothetical protein